MAGIKQIEASKLAPLSERLDALDKQEAEQQQEQSHPNPALSEVELASLQDMSRDRLLRIVLACNANAVRVLSLAEEAQAQLVLDTLLITAATSDDRKEARESAKLWMDRRLGPVVQKSVGLIGVAGSGEMSFAKILESLDGKSVGLPVIDN